MSTVQEIIDGIKHRLPERTNIYPALNRAVVMIAKRLFYHDVSMIRGSLSVSVAADSSSGSLPADFWGLTYKPYISGKQRFLEPVPDPRYKLRYTANATPIYFEIAGTTINLYPGTTSDITILGGYWAKPTKLTSPLDTMPFHEMFDDAIQEAIIHTLTTGNSTGGEIVALQNFIMKAVDEIAPYLDKPARFRVEDGMGLNFLTNEWDN
jgi:hypothetical protein